MATANEAKSALQQVFRDTWNKTRRGTGAKATGTGKTKPAIDEMMSLYRLAFTNAGVTINVYLPKFFVAVPTEELRDNGWPKEVEEWYGAEGLQMWRECVTCICYISMHKYRGEIYDLVVLDEAHHITVLNSGFFQSNVASAVMGLTGTYPDKEKEPDKWMLLNSIAPIVFTYKLDQGVDDGIVSDFELHIIMSSLDKVTKNIPAGNKDKPFKQTEAAAYLYLSKRIMSLQIETNNGLSKRTPEQLYKATKFAQLARHRFLCNLPSKLKLAKIVMESIVKPELRTLIFAGSIEQCNILGGENVYHSKVDDTALRKFMAMEINTLVAVNALNEGANIPALDQELIVQVSSNPRDLAQRVGRVVRFREGHKAMVYILCVQDTQDESWLKDSIKSFDEKRIFYHSSRSYGL